MAKYLYFVDLHLWWTLRSNQEFSSARPSDVSSPSESGGVLLPLLLTEDYTGLGVVSPRSCPSVPHPSWFRLLSRRLWSSGGFKALLRDTEGTSPSVSAGDGFGNTRPSVRRSFWRPCEATPLGGCRLRCVDATTPPSPEGAPSFGLQRRWGRPPLNSSESNLAAQPFHLKQQTDPSSCTPRFILMVLMCFWKVIKPKPHFSLSEKPGNSNAFEILPPMSHMSKCYSWIPSSYFLFAKWEFCWLAWWNFVTLCTHNASRSKMWRLQPSAVVRSKFRPHCRMTCVIQQKLSLAENITKEMFS